MDDKTAEIPSLKKFTAQSKKTSSDRQRKPQTPERNHKSGSGQSAQTRTSESAHNRPKNSADRRSQSTQRGSKQTGNRAGGTRASAPAPRTYARQRQDVSEAIARTQVVNTKDAYPESKPSDRYNNEYSAEPLRRQRSTEHSARTSDRAPQRTHSTGKDSTQRASAQRTAKGGSGSGNPPSGGRKPAAKNQKKPLSPRARKFRKIVINIGLCLLVLLAGIILSLTVWFHAETITVNGNGNIPKAEIISASGISIGDNIFTAPKGRAEDKIEKAFPYIQEAEVKSVFPNSISIDITMAEPSCIVEGLGGYYIVSSEGKVLDVAATTDEIQAPVIEGINVGGKVAGDFVEFGTTVVGEALKEMFTAFDELGCTEVTAINVAVEDEAVEIKYVHDNRIVVYLGIPEHITYKVQTAHTIIKEKIDTGGTMIAGDLDVSMCHDSMKSYFNQYTLLAPNSAHATEPLTTAPEETQPVTEVYYY